MCMPVSSIEGGCLRKKVHCFTTCILRFYLPICVSSLLLLPCCIVNKEDILCLFVFILISYGTDTQGKTTTEITLNTPSASMSYEFCFLCTENRRWHSKSSCLFTSHFYSKLVVLWRLITINTGIIS